jgi:hypothetical protein
MRIHILRTAGAPDLFEAVVHAPVPVGNNAAGFSWADCIKNSGMNTSILTVGTGAGQISNAENNQIANGTVIEASFYWYVDPAANAAQQEASLEFEATRSVNTLVARLQEQLRFFGKTRA